MDSTFAALLYLLGFRLAVIALGALCVFCGYRLFALDYSGAAEGKGSQVDVKLGKAGLSLKNAAPGAVFALFGAALVIAMLVSDAPEFVHERKGDSEKTTARADGGWGQLTLQDRQTIADELHRNAHAYRNQGKTHDALRLADYATRIDPDDANLWDTLASLHAETRAFSAAADAMEQALRLQPQQVCYRQRVVQFRQGQQAAECAHLPVAKP